MPKRPRKPWPLIDSTEDVPVEGLGELAGQCYQLIVESFQSRGIFPTQAELGLSMGINYRRVYTILRRLVSAGLIYRERPGTVRGFRLVSPDGCICPCCGGKGLLPPRKGNFGSPLGKRKVKEKVVFRMPDFVPPGLSLVGHTLRRKEVELLASLFNEFPGESWLTTGRRFQEKTGRLLSNGTVKKYHRILVSEGVVVASFPRKGDKRGMKLTADENNILIRLLNDYQSESDRKIAGRFFEITGRRLAKSTAQNIRKKLDAASGRTVEPRPEERAGS